MKRIICVLTTLVLTFAMVLSLSACGKEIENGSEITRVNFEIEFYNENGKVENTTTAATRTGRLEMSRYATESAVSARSGSSK